MQRLGLLLSCAAAVALVSYGNAAQAPARSRQSAFTVVEASIAAMRMAMAERRVTSRQIVAEYLTRLAIHEDRLNAAIVVNPKALDEADARDRERAAGRIRGPLHGIPIALKDNIHTTDLPTTGGALVFDGMVPPYEATLTKHLRAAGAIIIAKTGMTELANWVAIDMPGNYNALTGYGFNPYDPRRDPREGSDGRPVLSPGGSSSGIGTSANLWAASVGTETSGSILTPASMTMLVGVKPTVGRISRHGVIPIVADQDTPGPMARSVMDAATLLGVLEGASPDPNDPATKRCTAPPGHDYTRALRPGALKGARIGVPRALFLEGIPPPGSRQPRSLMGLFQGGFVNLAIAVLRREGAVIVDPADLPSVVDPDPARSYLRWGTCSAAGRRRREDEECSIVLQYGMKRDFSKWLASLGSATPVKSLTELIAWNAAHRGAGAIKYGQAVLEASDAIDLVADRARYEADRAKDLTLAAAHGIDEIMKAERLDALLFAGSAGSEIAAKAGYPSATVPFALEPVSGVGLPPGFNPHPQPVGITFTGLACSEPRLLELAYGFEQATRKRVPPTMMP